MEKGQSQEKLLEKPLDLAGVLVKMVQDIRSNSFKAIEGGINALEGDYKNKKVNPDDYLKTKEFFQKQKKEIEECNFDVQSIAVVVQFRDRQIPDLYLDGLKVGDKFISGFSDSEMYQKIHYLNFFLETILGRNSIAQIVSGVSGRVAENILNGVMKANSGMIDQILTMRLRNAGPIIPGINK